jgi:hypothetical protein
VTVAQDLKIVHGILEIARNREWLSTTRQLALNHRVAEHSIGMFSRPLKSKPFMTLLAKRGKRPHFWLLGGNGLLGRRKSKLAGDRFCHRGHRSYPAEDWAPGGCTAPTRLG